MAAQMSQYGVVLIARPPFFWPVGEGCEPPGFERLDNVVLGHDEGTFFTRRDDGTIVSVDPTGFHQERFVNGSEEGFTASLALFVPTWQALEGSKDDEAEARVANLRTRLDAIDPMALRDADSWWSVVLEQVQSGLL